MSTKQRYIQQKILSSSQNSSTEICYDQMEKRTVVLKKFPKNVKPLDRFLEEVNAQAFISSTGVIQTYSAFEENDNYVLVMEAGKTNLMDIIKHGCRSETLVKSLLPNVLVGLKDLHSNHIVHNDVKPENIVLCLDGKMKIIDFDLATIHDKEKCNYEHGVFGTWPYMSPEVVDGGDHTEKVDVWSMGVVMYVALTGVLPFEAPNQTTYLDNVKQQPFNKILLEKVHCSRQLIDLISTMLTKDPAKRPTISQCLKHEWFNSY